MSEALWAQTLPLGVRKVNKILMLLARLLHVRQSSGCLLYDTA